MTLTIKNIQRELKDSLKPLDPEVVILFGSYAYGEPHKDSDLDLFVVLKDNTMPESFKERQEIYSKVSSFIRPLAKLIPIDLLVYTLPMYKKLVESKNTSFDLILKKGIWIYEGNNPAVA
jgi:uncharacterized protein